MKLHKFVIATIVGLLFSTAAQSATVKYTYDSGTIYGHKSYYAPNGKIRIVLDVVFEQDLLPAYLPGSKLDVRMDRFFEYEMFSKGQTYAGNIECPTSYCYNDSSYFGTFLQRFPIGVLSSGLSLEFDNLGRITSSAFYFDDDPVYFSGGSSGSVFDSYYYPFSYETHRPGKWTMSGTVLGTYDVPVSPVPLPGSASALLAALSTMVAFVIWRRRGVSKVSVLSQIG